MSKIYMNAKNRIDLKAAKGENCAMQDDTETMEIVEEYVDIMENSDEQVLVNSNQRKIKEQETVESHDSSDEEEKDE